jgi:membrane protein YqaA with SNARE-associated domain
MELTTKLLTVLGLAAIELWAAIPAGFALNLHPVTIGITAAIGAMLGGVLVMLLGERVRTWLMRRHDRIGEQGQKTRLQRIWHRYGVIGLGLLAPLLTGAPLGVVLGLTLGAPSGRLLFWIAIGIVLWSTVLTLIGALGLAGVESIWR